MTDAGTIKLGVTLAPGGKGDPLTLRNPVMNAAGTFGTGTELRGLVDLGSLGALVTPGVTRTARAAGHNRYRESPAGLIWSLPYPSIGIRTVERRLAPLWRDRQTPVIVNLPAEDARECAELAARVAELDAASAIELSLLPSGRSAEEITAVVRTVLDRVRSATALPLIAKLPTDAPLLNSLARTAEEAGADALCVGRGFTAASLDPVEGARGTLSRGVLSGPATRPLALRAVHAVVGAVTLPVVACGGIATAGDAVEFLLAGATAVQVGSASFANPLAPVVVAEGLADLLVARGQTDVQDVIGAGRRSPLPRMPA